MTLSEYALKFVGRPYIWGGDGSGKCAGGFDCSGLVLECLWAFGKMPNRDEPAQGIFEELTARKWNYVLFGSEKPDDILFFGKDDKHITHVAIAIGNGLMVEAGGGGSKCKTLRDIGWQGMDFSTLNGGNDLEGVEVEITTEVETYEGNDYENVRFVNKPGHFANRGVKAMDANQAKADKLLSCLKYLVMGDLIKDCPPKKVATEIVKEYDNGLR